jgi:hypothetical protein
MLCPTVGRRGAALPCPCNRTANGRGAGQSMKIEFSALPEEKFTANTQNSPVTI